MEEKEKIKNLLGFHYFLQERIYKKSNQGYIKYKDLLLILRQHHNIPTEECSVIIRGLEILGLITKDKDYFKVKEPSKSREETILDYKKKLLLV